MGVAGGRESAQGFEEPIRSQQDQVAVGSLVDFIVTAGVGQSTDVY